MLELDELIEIWVGLLLVRQFDIAPHTDASCLFGATVRGFHNAGPSAGHHDKSGLCQCTAQLAGQLVIRMVLLEPCRTENRDAFLGEIEAFEAAQKLQEKRYCTFQILLPVAPSG